jgi:uncharacterized protein (TIGR02466 family)
MPEIHTKKTDGELISLFSTPIVNTNIGREFTEEEVDCFANIPIERNEKKRMQNHQSKDRYLFDSTFAEELKDIKSFCEHHLKQYLEEVEGVDTDLAGLRITQSWLNKNKPSESHHPHTHRNSYLSGVFYIRCLPNDHINLSNVLFGIYNNMEFPEKKITPWNTQGVIVSVKKGDLILFPSWVPHHVDVNETKDVDRISLSFDTFPIGEMGNYNDGTRLKLE